MDIKATNLIRGTISCIIEHNGFLFELSNGGQASFFSFRPDLTDKYMRDAVINQDKAFAESYSYLVKEYSQEVLENLWEELYNAARIIRKEGVGFDPAYGYIDNNTILSIIEHKLIQQSVKDNMLDNCEWVYVVGNAKEGKYKIGMTRRSPEKRINEFSPLLPFKTEIFALCPTTNAYELEKELHGKFRNNRTNGEWFNLSLGELVYMRSMSISEAGWK
ncbi:MAG: hypothetical protein BA863_12490 [Desulfovibrio sp. S3730MH75]|nr:MAG: hypothetical protein BA863_12490 [Desulfovibrio sp. S3730MH75]